MKRIRIYFKSGEVLEGDANIFQFKRNTVICAEFPHMKKQIEKIEIRKMENELHFHHINRIKNLEVK